MHQSITLTLDGKNMGVILTSDTLQYCDFSVIFCDKYFIFDEFCVIIFHAKIQIVKYQILNLIHDGENTVLKCI